MERGTEAFPDLGQHCQHEDCNQLDFLPFTCAGCRKVFCLDHRTYKSHGCPRAEQHSRTVVVCEACSASIEKQAGAEDDGDEKAILQRHVRSGDCHPARKKRPRCPVGRCKEVLTFSNSTTCKMCTHKVCLKHRFPSDHDCSSRPPTAAKSPVSWPARNGTDCGDMRRPRMPTNPPPIKAC